MSINKRRFITREDPSLIKVITPIPQKHVGQILTRCSPSHELTFEFLYYESTLQSLIKTRLIFVISLRYSYDFLIS